MTLEAVVTYWLVDRDVLRVIPCFRSCPERGMGTAKERLPALPYKSYDRSLDDSRRSFVSAFFKLGLAYLLGGLIGAYDLQQGHDVGWTEEVSSHNSVSGTRFFAHK